MLIEINPEWLAHYIIRWHAVFVLILAVVAFGFAAVVIFLQKISAELHAIRTVLEEKSCPEE